MIGGKAEVGTFLLQDMEQPMGEFDIAIAGALGVPQGLYEGFVADAVQFPGYCFKADVGHGRLLLESNWNIAQKQTASISSFNMPSGSGLKPPDVRCVGARLALQRSLR